MESQVSEGQLCAQLGALLEYPVDDAWDIWKATAGQIEPISGQSCVHLNSFYAKMKRMELGMRQEYYVQSFDLMPKCSLYLSVHLFGEESFKRAEFMAGLKSVYEKHGVSGMTELPDHLAVILKQRALFDEEEWSELVAMCLLPALPKMIGALEKCENPYALVLKAVQALLVEMEKAHV